MNLSLYLNRKYNMISYSTSLINDLPQMNPTCSMHYIFINDSYSLKLVTEVVFEPTPLGLSPHVFSFLRFFPRRNILTRTEHSLFHKIVYSHLSALWTPEWTFRPSNVD